MGCRAGKEGTRAIAMLGTVALGAVRTIQWPGGAVVSVTKTCSEEPFPAVPHKMVFK